MKKPLIYILGFVLFFAGMIWWSKSLQSKDPDVIARSGLHWHPTLAIYVNGEKQEVPPNIGITGGAMMPMHTHEPDGTVHVESAGVVRKDDITLGKFFKIWGKDINSFGTNVKMTVNGKENAEYENYAMQDKDQIELRFD
ncbi:MAG: hypothetical protein WBL19_01160 [Minisyncoccia bacterium]